MVTPQYPGVYIEEVHGGARPIEGVEPSVAAFIGEASRGPVGTAKLISSFAEYTETYGPIESEADEMGFAVWAFYENGGEKAYVARLSGGDGAAAPDGSDYVTFFSNFAGIKDPSIIILPGKFIPKDGGDDPAISAAITHANQMKNRLVIIDIEKGYELKDKAGLAKLALPTSSGFAVAYYPWLKVSNPRYKPDTNSGAAKTVTIAPSALVAGMWSRVDKTRGVWKAPAGQGSELYGVSETQFVVEEAAQELLSSGGINAIRGMGSSPAVIWGAHTLAIRGPREWRYVQVRRTAIFIEESVYNGIKWAVFEANDPNLWAHLHFNITGFMDKLFRDGAFQGKTASDAYFVRCGLDDTMTQSDIDTGRVIIHIGFAPLKPAEFVILKVDLIVSAGD